MLNSSGRVTTKLLLCIILTALFACFLGGTPKSRAQGAPDYVHGWQRLGVFGNDFDGGNTPPAWSPDGHNVALIQLKAVHVVNAYSGMLDWTYACRGHWAGAAFPNNTTIVLRDGATGGGTRLRIFDIRTHALLTTYTVPLDPSITYNFQVDPTGQYVLASNRVVRLSDGQIISAAFGHGPTIEGFGPFPYSVFVDDPSQTFYTTLQGFTGPNEALSGSAFYGGVIVWTNDLRRWVHSNGGGTYMTDGSDGHGGGFTDIFDFSSPFRVVTRPTFSPDSTKLCMFGGGTLGMWDVTGSLPVLSWTTNPSALGNHIVTFAPDSARVADSLQIAGSYPNAESRIFSATDGSTLQRLTYGSGPPVMAQSPNGLEVAACSKTGDTSVNREIRIFSSNEGALLRTLPIAGVTFLAYLSQDKLVVSRASTSPAGYFVETLDATTGVVLWSAGPYQGVFGMDVVPNQYVIASYVIPTDNYIVSRWNADGTNRQDISRTVLQNIAVSPDGQHFAGIVGNGPSSHYLITYNVQTLASEYSRSNAYGDYNNTLAWSPDNNRIADVGRFTPVTVYDLAANNSFSTGDGTKALAAAWSASGNYLAVSHQPYDTPPSKVSFYSVGGNALTEIKMFDSGVGETFVTALQFTADGSGMLYGTYGGTVGRFDVPEPVYVPQKLSTISLSPTSVVGGNSSTGTVTIDLPAGAAGTVVSLTSLNGSLAHVPASVTVSAGLTTATFAVTTEGVAANTVVGIQGSCNGVTKTANLTLKPAALMSISLNPSSLTGGTDSTATVTLTGKTAANASITLSTTNSAASLPANVVVPGGASSATFTLHTVPVSANTAGAVSAVFNGLTKSATLTVKAPVLSSVASPGTVTGGALAGSTVFLTGPVVADTTVSLASTNSAAHVPANVVVPAGSSSAAFSINTDVVTVTVAGSISATYNGVTKTATITVKPAALVGLSLSSNSVSGGVTITGSVTFMSAVGADTTVTLGSANSAAHPPASVIVPAGTTSATFSISTDIVAAKTMGSISATYNGVTKTAALTVNPAVLQSLTLSPTSISNGGTSVGTVAFATPVSADTEVVITNTNTAANTVSSVVVPAGATSATFYVYGNVMITSKVVGVITATYGGVSKSVTLTRTPAAYLSFTLTPSTVVGGNSVSARVLLDGNAAVDTVVTLTNANAKAMLPGPTVTILAGHTLVDFTITTVATASNVSGAVTAKVGTVTKSVTLKVTP